MTIRLGNAIVDKLRAKFPENTVVRELDLLSDPFPHLTAFHLNAFNTPAHQRTSEQAAAAIRSEAAIRELMEADIIVIGVPMHNYSIPSALKAFIDHVVRAGLTFGISENGAEGLLKNKKAYIAFAAGWNFSDPDTKPYDFSVPYLKTVLAFIGIKDITEFRVEGVIDPPLKELALQKVVMEMGV